MSGHILAAFESGVLRVTMNRPEKLNALNVSMIGELGSVFAAWSTREEVAVATLIGAGTKCFVSGGDIKELSAIRTEAEAMQFSQESMKALDAIRKFSVPVVALLNGDALGGGAEVAIACDLRIAAPHAKIGFLQARLNVSTGWGGGADLFRLLGSSKALELLSTASTLDSTQALHCGLLNAVAPAGADFEEFAAGYVARIAAQKPQVLRAFKALAIMQRDGIPASGRAAKESAVFARTWAHEDHWAAVDELNKRLKGR